MVNLQIYNMDQEFCVFMLVVCVLGILPVTAICF